MQNSEWDIQKNHTSCKTCDEYAEWLIGKATAQGRNRARGKTPTSTPGQYHEIHIKRVESLVDSSPTSLTGVMARIIDPEAWKEPLSEDRSLAMRRMRSLQKTEKLLAVLSRATPRVR